MGITGESSAEFLAGNLPAEDQLALTNYNQAWFKDAIPSAVPSLPLPPEPSLAVWQEYAEEARDNHWPEVLAEKFPAFRFPIADGISQTPEYRQAINKGEGGSLEAIAWQDPSRLKLIIAEPPSGPIPVLSTDVREDFETLLRVFLYRNEPRLIPPSMGAVMISGLVNRDRINRLRETFMSENPGARAGAWLKEWATIKNTSKELFQDRLILIGPGPYSGIPAESANLSASEWENCSRIIRIHHECTHLFCKRVFGRMQNNLLDELFADFIGLRESFGYFPADLFLRGMGISSNGELGLSGRFYNYLKEPELPDSVWKIQAHLLAKAAHHLEAWKFSRKDSGKDPVGRILLFLAQYSLPEIASRPLPETLS